jgi:hypothetical protein
MIILSGRAFRVGFTGPELSKNQPETKTERGLRPWDTPTLGLGGWELDERTLPPADPDRAAQMRRPVAGERERERGIERERETERP